MAVSESKTKAARRIDDDEAHAGLLPGKRSKKPVHVCQTVDGVRVSAKLVPKFWRDLYAYHLGAEPTETGTVTVFDPANPLQGAPLLPGPLSPICVKCALHENEAVNPYFAYKGPENPLITLVVEMIGRKEDQSGVLASDGWNRHLASLIEDHAMETGVTPDMVRWVPVTRCANQSGEKVNYKIKAKWCRSHLVDDLNRNRPQFIIPVGTSALGALSHKSSAQDWGGRLLTYRGWPDDWLTDPSFVKPRPHPNGEGEITGHPLFGALPGFRLPMMPIQSPHIVQAAHNEIVYKRWLNQFVTALKLAREGAKVNSYDRPWYRITTDVDEIINTLYELAGHAGLLVAYDTETNSLRQFDPDSRIVFMMFRWVDPASGKPRALGFPWDYLGSPLQPAIAEIKPYVYDVLYRCTLVGHNLTFDVLFTYGTDKETVDLDRLADAAVFDTWHEAFAARQQPGMRSLDMIAYDYVPDLAGYEEEMTLLIDLEEQTMNPESGKHAHYANCPPEKWETHLKPYVMGDVEVCYRAHEVMQMQLDKCKLYKIPLAHPVHRGMFRAFQPPRRNWMYTTIMSPASRMLMKLMGRGMYVSLKTLGELEVSLPNQVRERREELRKADPRILPWCESKFAQDHAWELDLENKTQLKHILFDIMQLPVERLTKTGQALYGEGVDGKWFRMEGRHKLELTREELIEYAALDKFTLNKMAADHPSVRPLQEYRKVFKLYSTYIRPLRNIFNEDIDTKQRTDDPHLIIEDDNYGVIHTSFLLTGTRGGRLSSRRPNLQQLPRDGEVKKMFVSRFGEAGCLYNADLNQIELRLLAAACGDESMVGAYLSNTDLHSLTASRVFKVPYEHYTKDYMQWLQENKKTDEAKVLDYKRGIAKTLNFLTAYGGGAFGLQTTLAARAVYLDIRECEKIIDAFFSAYPSLKRFLTHYKRFIQDTGVAVSLFGRVRIFEEVFSDDREAISKALRAGANHLIQSTASDMMLIALIVIESLMRQEGLESLLVSTVHDSLLIDARRAELSQIHHIVSSVLNNFDEVLPLYFGEGYDASWMILPFSSDAECGIDYLNLHKVQGSDPDWDKLLAA